MAHHKQNINIKESGLPPRLSALREERHLSQADLADRAGLSYRTVHDLELGKRDRAQEKTLLMLARALDLTLEDLLGGPRETAPVIHRRPFLRPRILLPAVLVAILSLTAVVVVWAAGRNARLEVQDHQLTVRDGILGLKLWSIGHPPGVGSCLVAPWSDREVLVGFVNETPSGQSFLCLDRASGDTIWTFTPDLAAVRRAFGEDVLLGGNLSGNRIIPCDLDGDGVQEVLFRFMHQTNYPCILAWVDRHGRLLGQYANHGHLTDILPVDLDGDGKQEVLATGTTNARVYQGATVVILDEDHYRGASVDGLTHPETTEPDSALVRLIIPNFPEPYMQALKALRLHATRPKAASEPDGSMRISVTFGPHQNLIGMVQLDERLELVDSLVEDVFLEQMRGMLPDSLIDGTGPADPAWREHWLEGCIRFEAGHWPPAQD